MYCHTECRDTHANAGHKLGLSDADGNVGPVVICGKCFTTLTAPKDAAGAYYTRFRCGCGQVLEVPGAADWVPGAAGGTPCDVVKSLRDKQGAAAAIDKMANIGSIGSIEWRRARCSNEGCQKFGRKKCAKCKATKYCGRKCQLAHWKAGHKRECKNYQKIRAGMLKQARAEQDASAEAARRVKLGLGVRPAFAQRAHDNAVRWESERHAEAMEASLLRDLNPAPAKKKKKKKKKKRKSRKKKQTAPQLASPAAVAAVPPVAAVAAVPRARMRLRTTSAPPRINYYTPPPRPPPRQTRRVPRTRSFGDLDPSDKTYREFGWEDENPGAAQNEPRRRRLKSFGGGVNRQRIWRRRTHRKGRRKRRRTRRKRRRKRK